MKEKQNNRVFWLIGWHVFVLVSLLTRDTAYPSMYIALVLSFLVSAYFLFARKKDITRWCIAAMFAFFILRNAQIW